MKRKNLSRFKKIYANHFVLADIYCCQSKQNAVSFFIGQIIMAIPTEYVCTPKSVSHFNRSILGSIYDLGGSPQLHYFTRNTWQPIARCSMGVGYDISFNLVRKIIFAFDFRLIFLSIFTLEFVIKVIARGFILGEFTYLRDPWNYFDLFVLIHA